MHCLRQKSQHLRLLFIEQYMDSNRVLPKRVKKKKKRKTQTGETQTCIQTNTKWIIMAPKGKAHVQDYSQNKRLPAGQPFRMHEGASSGVKPNRATSL